MAGTQGNNEKKEAGQVDGVRTCRALWVVQVNLDIILRTLRGFKQGSDINKWVLLNDILDVGWKLDSRQGGELRL